MEKVVIERVVDYFSVFYNKRGLSGVRDCYEDAIKFFCDGDGVEKEVVNKVFEAYEKVCCGKNPSMRYFFINDEIRGNVIREVLDS